MAVNCLKMGEIEIACRDALRRALRRHAAFEGIKLLGIPDAGLVTKDGRPRINVRVVAHSAASGGASG